MAQASTDVEVEVLIGLLSEKIIKKLTLFSQGISILCGRRTTEPTLFLVQQRE